LGFEHGALVFQGTLLVAEGEELIFEGFYAGIGLGGHEDGAGGDIEQGGGDGATGGDLQGLVLEAGGKAGEGEFAGASREFDGGGEAGDYGTIWIDGGGGDAGLGGDGRGEDSRSDEGGSNGGEGGEGAEVRCHGDGWEIEFFMEADFSKDESMTKL